MLALREYYRREGKHQDSLPDDEIDTDLPEEAIEAYYLWCMDKGGEALVREVAECLDPMEKGITLLRLAATYASRANRTDNPDVSLER